MFKGIPGLREVMNSIEEWHTAWTGFCHSFYTPRFIPLKKQREIQDEYHYYSTGRMAGQVVKVGLITAIVAGITIIWRRRR